MFGTSLERPGTWAIIAIAALVLFGYKRLPEVTRSVGKSLRIFKAEMKGLSSDDDAREAADAAKTPPATSASDARPTSGPVEPPTVAAQPTAPAVEATPASTPEQTPPKPSS
jgi:sec-independent protein translocase protein TatA